MAKNSLEFGTFSIRNSLLLSLRSRRKHKAWGGAQRNPRDNSAIITLARDNGRQPEAGSAVGFVVTILLTPAAAGSSVAAHQKVKKSEHQPR